MNLRQTLLAASVLAIFAAGCQGQNEAYVNADNSSAEDSAKLASDVHGALSNFGDVEVLDTGAGGVPTFVRGRLGKLDPSLGLAPINGTSLRDNLDRIAPIFRLSSNDLTAVSSSTDALGFKHITYRQSKNGLPVVGGDLRLHVKRDGNIYAVNGMARDGISLSPEASVTAETAIAAARNGISAASAAAPRLVYLLDAKSAMHLAWEVEVSGQRGINPVRDLVYVNARNGSVVETHPQIHTALNREVHNLNNGTALPGPLARSEGGALNADAIVNTNYDRLGDVYNCYKTLFNRDSYDNAGAKLISSVHYSTNYVNAYWDGTQMVYGDGDGVQADNLAKSMDVTAHELTHAVTERSPTSPTPVSPAASTSPCPTSSATSARVPRRRRSPPTPGWWARTSGRRPPRATRSATWTTRRRTATSLDYYTDYNSGVDVHYSSGIANLAFYLSRRVARTRAATPPWSCRPSASRRRRRSWYRALTTYMTASTNFTGARTATKQAATDLYDRHRGGRGGQGWTAVGVGVPIPPPTTTPLTNGVALTGLAGVTNSQNYYTLAVPAGQTSLKFVMRGGTGDADMYVKFGAAPTTQHLRLPPVRLGQRGDLHLSPPPRRAPGT